MESLRISFEKKVFLLFTSLKFHCNFLILRLRLLQVNSVVALLIYCQLTVNVTSAWFCFSFCLRVLCHSRTHRVRYWCHSSKLPLSDLLQFPRTCLLWFRVFCSSLKLCYWYCFLSKQFSIVGVVTTVSKSKIRKFNLMIFFLFMNFLLWRISKGT